jgi:hypothetical protein
LEYITERGFPFATAQALEINTASLQNLRKQKFEVFNQYSVYEHTLALPTINGSSRPMISVREINRSDRPIFKEIENKTTYHPVLSIKGSVETQYFLPGWKRIYARFTWYSRWIKGVVEAAAVKGVRACLRHANLIRIDTAPILTCHAPVACLRESSLHKSILPVHVVLAEAGQKPGYPYSD